MAQPAPEPTIRGEVSEKSLEVNGRVKSQIGGPASGVTVIMEFQDMRTRREVATETTKTDADGSFHFNLDKYAEIPKFGIQFDTISPHYRSATKISIVTHDQFPLSIDFALSEGSVAKGHVVDDFDKPVEGANVNIGDARPAMTDANGDFEIMGLPLQGTYQAIAVKENYSDGTAQFQIDPDRLTENILLRLSAAAKMEGVAINPEGKPIDAGQVTVFVGTLYQRTRLAANGTFKFDVLPTNLGELTIRLNTAEYLPVERKFTAEEQASRKVTLQTAWALNLEGFVYDVAGKPRSGGEVVIGDNLRQPTFRFHTDETGKWSAGPFPIGEPITITAMASSSLPRRTSGELEFKTEEKPNEWAAEVNPWPSGCISHFNASIKDLQVTMTRTDKGPNALPGVVTYTGTIEPDFKSMKGTIFVATTGAKGDFTATAYAPSGSMKGVWDLRESLGEGNWTEAPSQKVIAGAPFSGTQHVDLQLSAPLALAGVVRNEDGSPVPTGFVSLKQWNQTNVIERVAPITAGGKFMLRGLPRGLLLVVVMDDTGKPVARPTYMRGGLENAELYVGARPADPLELVDSPAK
ncbi:carboxypeptidase regulatory-like domain-containing protein [Candidatus Sumerlaeota bacterium]|nr:carboxypeptidase regulatory-like domain-containing protein [Candidatus Sumerlaeota bacterium]